MFAGNMGDRGGIRSVFSRESEMPRRAPLTFRVVSKSFFVTWARSGEFDLERMYKHYNNLREVEYFGISAEHHEDGGLHHHALMIYAKRFNLTNSRYFDWVNNDGEVVHPSIEAARSVDKVFEYVTKEGFKFSEWGERPISVKKKIGSSNLYEFARKMEYEEFMTACRAEKIPYGYVQDAQSRRKYDLCVVKEGDPVDGVLSPPLDSFSYDFESSDRKSLVIVGPTGIGKTTWAKLHLPRPILIVRCLETLKAFDPGYHNSILFDDMTFTGWARDVQVYLVDRYDPSGINVKHGSVVLDTAAVRMFSNNHYPFSNLPEIKRRTMRVNVDFMGNQYRVHDGADIDIPSGIPVVRSLRDEQLDRDLPLGDPSPLADPISVNSEQIGSSTSRTDVLPESGPIGRPKRTRR